jgi:hypothetical protein
MTTNIFTVYIRGFPQYFQKIPGQHVDFNYIVIFQMFYNSSFINHPIICRVYQEDSAILRYKVRYVNLDHHNQESLHPKMNCYGWWEKSDFLGFHLLYLFNDKIYLLTASGLPSGGICTILIYTQTVDRTTQNKQCIEQHKIWVQQKI